MKNVLLLLLIVVLGLPLIAQNKQACIKNTKQLKKSIPIENAGTNESVFSGTKSLDLINIASTLNGYTLVAGKKLTADQLSNTILYVSRGGPNTGTYVANDIHLYNSVDNGMTWDTLVFSNSNDHRYPGASLFRISGDTNLYVVSSGPIITGSDFNKNYFFSSKIDGTLANDTSILIPAGSDIFHVNEGHTVLPSGELFVFGEKNGLEANSYPHIDYSIFKFQWDNINKKFHYVSTKAITHLTSATQPPVQPSGLAFSNDGNVGYMWFNGMDSIASPNLGTQPIVYRTNDKGATWNLMPLYDFSQIQLLQDSLWSLRANPIKIRPVFPYGYTSSDKNMPGVVDALGNLHLIVNIQGGYSEHPDSLGYSFVNEPTKLFDLFTTATGWDAKYITSLTSTVDDGTAGTFGEFALDHRIHAGKTADGNIIFAMWTDTDPNYATTNTVPSFMAKAFNLIAGRSTHIKNFSAGTASEGIMNYMNASEIILADAGVYTIPVVVIDGATPEDAITHKYATGLEFSDAEFDIECTQPITQATAFNSSAITDSSMTIGWTRGDGNGGVIVLARAGSAVNAYPLSGTNYTDSTVFGSGTAIGNNYVVYKGTGTSVNITGLASGTPYYYAVYEYNSSETCFKTPGLIETVTTTGAAPLPVGGIATATPAAICSGGNTSLLQLTGFIGTIQWQDSTVGTTWANVTGGIGATTADYTTANLTVETFYRAIVSQTGIPSVFVYSNVISVAIIPLPATPTITKANPAPSYANVLTSSAGTTYKWYNSSGIISGAHSKTYTVPANESYYVIVTNINGCSSLPSNTIVINNVGINFHSENNFNIYPNPVNNILSVELNGVSNTVISILDIIGNKVLEVIPTNNKTNINLSNLSSGVYMIRVLQNGKISTQKLIKE